MQSTNPYQPPEVEPLAKAGEADFGITERLVVIGCGCAYNVALVAFCVAVYYFFGGWGLSIALIGVPASFLAMFFLMPHLPDFWGKKRREYLREKRRKMREAAADEQQFDDSGES